MLHHYLLLNFPQTLYLGNTKRFLDVNPIGIQLYHSLIQIFEWHILNVNNESYNAFGG